jgi:hypothetical protein
LHEYDHLMLIVCYPCRRYTEYYASCLDKRRDARWWGARLKSATVLSIQHLRTVS